MSASARDPGGAPPLRVRVPGSTSNLGPGFDLLGVALSLWLEVELQVRSEGDDRIEAREGEAADWPDPGGNLLFRALDRAAEALAFERPRVRVRVRSEIPVGRGFGSSGAAVVAGLLLGTELAGAEPDPTLLAGWGAELEGHPDNSTASLFGGCMLALPHPGGLCLLGHDLHPEIGFAIAWPAQPLSTERARAALPAVVPFADAMENPRRLAMLLEGLRRCNAELLTLGGEDRLHVPYRLPLVPGAREALDAARAAGAFVATISGSGSGLVALAPHRRCKKIAEAMRRELDGRPGPAHARVVEPVLDPPYVEAASS